MNAQDYFGRWDEYVDRYDEKLVVLNDGEVIFDVAIDHLSLGELMKAVRDRELDVYQPFYKLVAHEEVELSEPYEVAV